MFGEATLELDWDNSPTLPLHGTVCLLKKNPVKRRNQEDPQATAMTLVPRWLRKTRTTRWAKQYTVLPQKTLGQISIAPWTDQPPPREKKRNWVISSKNNKDTWQRGWRALSAEEVGRGIPHGTVNKQAGRRRQEWWHTPSNQEQESL
jgi:hypothetical protein